MGKGSSAPEETTSVVHNSNLPDYAEPYFHNLMQRGQAESYRPYTPYEGQRVAEFTPGQEQTQQNIMGLQAPDQLGAASDLAAVSGVGSLMAGQYDPTQFSSQQVTNPALQNYQMGPDQEFGQAQADQYMSPYFQNVVDIAKRAAIRDAQKTQLMTNLNAAREGTYGGARQLLAGTQRERALGRNLTDIQERGLQSAYENAQQQFERDRASRFGINSANIQSALQTQGLGSEQAMQAALANQSTDLESQRLGEMSKQFSGSLGLQGLDQALRGAQTLGQLGATQQDADLARLQAQSAVGAEQQGQQQRGLDLAYADFLRQRDYPMEQLGYYSNLLRGIPVGLSSTETTYQAPGSTAAQVLGAGAGLYGATRGFGGFSGGGPVGGLGVAAQSFFE